MNKDIVYLCKNESDFNIIKKYYIDNYNTDCSDFYYNNTRTKVIIFYPCLLYFLPAYNKLEYSSRIKDDIVYYDDEHNNTKNLLRKLKLKKIND